MRTITKVALIAFLWITLVNRGTLGSIDTALRADMSHAWWTGTAEVASDYKPFVQGDVRAGVIGKDGRRYISWDLGQSILMLPSDWIGTQIHKLMPAESEIKLRHTVISYLTFVPLNVAAIVACYWLITLFGFQEKTAGLASIVCLLCTTILHYSQEHQQVNQVLLFVLIGYASALTYVKTHVKTRVEKDLKQDKNYFVILSGLAASAAFLIRMSSAIHAATILLFLLSCLALQKRAKVDCLKATGLWVMGFLPLSLLVGILNYFRYGNFWDFGQKIAVEQLVTDPIWQGVPALPANYPLVYSPDVGILGVLFSPAKSIFMYDPLLLPCLVIACLFWRRLSPYIQCYLIASILNLAGHIVLTSRYLYWAADDSWGAKYQVTSVHLLIIPLVAFLIHKYLINSLAKKNLIKLLITRLFQGILTIALIVQIASISLHYGVEIVQAESMSDQVKFQQFRLGQRFTNIACQFNHTFTDRCVKNATLIPFRANPKFFLVLWNLLLVLAILATAWFVSMMCKSPRLAT